MDSIEPPRKSEPLSLIKRGIEECGKHPFATGLFALLGVFGLLFAFYDFNVSQSQAEENTQAQADIRQELEEMRATVAELQSVEEDQDDFVPLEAALFSDAIEADNLIFSSAFVNDRSVSFKSEDINDTIEELYKKDPNSFFDIFSVSFNVTSTTDRNYVQLAPYLVIDVRSAKPEPDETVQIYLGGRGAGKVVREFNIILEPYEGLQFAAVYGSSFRDEDQSIDYFNLSPREPEEFILNINSKPGIVYEMRVGIHYKYRNKHRIHWVTPFVRHGLTAHRSPTWTWGSNEAFAPPEEEAFVLDPSIMAKNEAQTRKRIEDDRQFVEGGKVFRPSMIPAEYTRPRAPAE